MTVEVLVITMHQTDYSLVEKMNLKTNAVIANQCDREEAKELKYNDKFVRFVSTITRGASKNRNIAIENSSSDILLFADDDLVFNDDYEQVILNEFNSHPDADAIKFNLHDLSDSRKITMKRISKFSRATRKNMSASGVWGLAIKRSVLLNSGVLFNEKFGPGVDLYCGEDTIFLQQLLNKKIKFYRSPLDIAGIDQSTSSWFKGYDETYFYVKGHVFAVIYPKFCKLLAIRSALKFKLKRRTNLPFKTILKSYFSGINNQRA